MEGLGVAALIQEFLDALAATDPESVARVLIEDPEGMDNTLLQFQAFSGDRERTKGMMGDIDGLWFADDDAIAMTSQYIMMLTTWDEIKDRQTKAIIMTIAAALGILTVFFWITLRQPALGFIAFGADRARPDMGVGHDGAAGHSLHDHHLDHHGTLHRDRRGLHDPRDPPLPGRVHQAAQPGEGGGSDPRHHRLCSAGLGPDDSVRVRGADAVAAGVIRAVRHHGGDHDRVLADRLHRGGAARHDVVVPPAMTVWGAYQNMRLRSMVQRLWDELYVAIKDTHRRYEQEGGSS